MNKTRSGLAIIGIGIIVALISLFADTLGVGGQAGFGWKQTVGVVVGAGLVLLGIVRSRF